MVQVFCGFPSPTVCQVSHAEAKPWPVLCLRHEPQLLALTGIKPPSVHTGIPPPSPECCLVSSGGRTLHLCKTAFRPHLHWEAFHEPPKGFAAPRHNTELHALFTATKRAEKVPELGSEKDREWTVTTATGYLPCWVQVEVWKTQR